MWTLKLFLIQKQFLKRKKLHSATIMTMATASPLCYNRAINKKENMSKIVKLVVDNKDRTEKRTNRFNGESVMLTKEEARRHDLIFLCETMATIEDQDLGTGGSPIWETMRGHLDWFRKNNAEAYMVLLD